MKEKERSNNNLIALLSSAVCLVNGLLILLNYSDDKIGIIILYCRIGLIIALWLLCIASFICFFVKRMVKSKQKVLLLILSLFLALLQIPSFADCCADLAGGTKSVVTNKYPVVWDKILLSSSGEDYAYVSEEIAEILNENKVISLTSNYELERENDAEVVYYPRTHILISAEIAQQN